MAHLVVKKESGEMESERVNMKSRGNDEIKPTLLKKVWDEEKKACEPEIYVN